MKLVHIVCADKPRCGSARLGVFVYMLICCFVSQSQLNLTGGNAFPFWPSVYCSWAAEAVLSLFKESYFQRGFSSQENKSVVSRAGIPI